MEQAYKLEMRLVDRGHYGEVLREHFVSIFISYHVRYYRLRMHQPHDFRKAEYRI